MIYVYHQRLHKRIEALEQAWAWAMPQTFGWVDSQGNITNLSENKAARRLRERAERLDPQLKLDYRAGGRFARTANAGPSLAAAPRPRLVRRILRSRKCPPLSADFRDPADTCGRIRSGLRFRSSPTPSRISDLQRTVELHKRPDTVISGTWTFPAGPPA